MKKQVTLGPLKFLEHVCFSDWHGFGGDWGRWVPLLIQSPVCFSTGLSSVLFGPRCIVNLLFVFWIVNTGIKLVKDV